MKHLKSINELFKSTYLSAADKLKMQDRHKGRAEELIKHAAEIGQDTPHERIWPFRFIFPGSLENEFYSIQSVEEQKADWQTNIYINFKSNYGNNKRMELNFNLYAPVIAKQRNPEQLRHHLGSSDDNFHFKLATKTDTGFTHPDSRIARKNALELRNFFLEYWEDELSEKYPNYILSNFTVNNLYRS